MSDLSTIPAVAIVCGGTGGHLFPGIAIAEALLERGVPATAFITGKAVDQIAAQTAPGMEVVTLPAVAWQSQGFKAFIRGYRDSYRTAKKTFRTGGFQAAIAMGGFISVPALWAARRCGIPCFLHEANAVPGRANRLLSWWAEEAFIFFPQCAPRLGRVKTTLAGMPIRAQFQVLEASACRQMLGLHPERPVLLVMGGSQGASTVNQLILDTLPHLVKQLPDWQYLHLTGARDADRVKTFYAQNGGKAVVRPFLTEMELALNAATLCISRAGASSLAELAALRVPAILMPYPVAANNHQFYNALAFMETGAARMVSHKVATPAILTDLVMEIAGQEKMRETMKTALATWHRPDSAQTIATRLMAVLSRAAAAGNKPASNLTKDMAPLPQYPPKR